MHFENYSLRLLQQDDLDLYFEMVDRNRKRLANFFTGTVSRTATLEDTIIFLADVLNRAKEKTYFPYLLIDTETNRPAGFFDIKNIDWTVPKAELGCYIDEEYESKGISTKAFEIFIKHCFNYYGFKKLFLRTHYSNIGARRIAEKCGFEIEGTLRRDYKTTAGELVDLLYYGKLSDD